jgi:Flp pilus assembly pilin Flp
MGGIMLSTIVTWVVTHLRNEVGQDVVEWALLTGLIAAALIGVGFAAYELALQDFIDGVSACIDLDNTSICNI